MTYTMMSSVVNQVIFNQLSIVFDLLEIRTFPNRPGQLSLLSPESFYEMATSVEFLNFHRNRDFYEAAAAAKIVTFSHLLFCYL